MANDMHIDPGQEEIIRKIAHEEVEKSIESVQLSVLKEAFLTRDEFLEAMERIDKRFNTMQERMDKRFNATQERMDKRFNTMQEQMDKRFDEVYTEIKHVQVSIDSLGDRSGKALENTILELLRAQLVENHVDYNSIEREELFDEDGVVFHVNYRTDIDVVAKDGTISLFEIKYRADQRDIAHFLKVAELYERVHGVKPTYLYVVSLEIANKTLKATAALPVIIIAGKVLL
jgi:hypothetical protein